MMPRTASGRDPFETLSVVQKAIRRGDELLAAQFALEMLRSVPNTRKMLLSYLQQVILYEDMGPVDYPAMIYAQNAVNVALVANDRSDASDPKKERVSLATICAIIAMCRARKSRIANHLYYVARHKPLPPTPDWAKDMHTSEGKKMGRGIDHFLEEGLKMHREVTQTDYADPYKGPAWSLWRQFASGEVKDAWPDAKPESLFERAEDAK